MKFIWIFLFLLMGMVSVQSQDSTLQELKEQGRIVLSREPDSARLPVHAEFRTGLDSLLRATKDSLLPLDSLSNLSVLYAPDSSLRVITWMFPYDNGAYQFFGFLHYKSGNNNWNLVELKDKHKSIKEPQKKRLSPGKWYGALYYDIIVHDSLITLLGWNGYHRQKKEKIIETLWFDEDSEPVFGKKVFPEYRSNYEENVSRVIFQYANEATMALRYAEVLHEVEEPRENRMIGGVKRVKKRQNLIVFNKLEPIQPMFEGDFKYYVPLSEKLLGFSYDKGQWILLEDVKILSEQAPVVDEARPELNLFPQDK
jgi:hypothetical protein